MTTKTLALVKDGVVQQVIVGDAVFLAKTDTRWRAQFDDIVDSTDHSAAENGGTYDARTKQFTRAVPNPAVEEARLAQDEEFKARVLAVLREAGSVSNESMRR